MGGVLIKSKCYLAPVWIKTDVVPNIENVKFQLFWLKIQ